MIIKKIKNFLTDPVARMSYLTSLGCYDKMSDEKYLRKKYKLLLGEELNLESPQKLSEKIQWLKLYDRNPYYIKLADKSEVKKIVAEKIGEEHVIPLYGTWDRFDDIDFNILPEQFILKCTHDSGGFVICKDKSLFDKAEAKRRLEKSLKRNYYKYGREWVYSGIKPRIIAEKYIPTLGKADSVEYKITCYNGRVEFITICKGIAHAAFELRSNDNYDRNFNYLPFYAFYHNTQEQPKPKEMDEIIRLSEILAEGIPYVRVDWYVEDGCILFGEMTFYTWSGFIRFTPKEWDEKLGKALELPKSGPKIG